LIVFGTFMAFFGKKLFTWIQKWLLQSFQVQAEREACLILRKLGSDGIKNRSITIAIAGVASSILSDLKWTLDGVNLVYNLSFGHLWSKIGSIWGGIKTLIGHWVWSILIKGEKIFQKSYCTSLLGKGMKSAGQSTFFATASFMAIFTTGPPLIQYQKVLNLSIYKNPILD